MSSHKNQKQQLEQLNLLYQKIRSTPKNLFEMLNLLAKAKDIYKHLQKSKNKQDFSVYKVDASIQHLNEDSLKSSMFDWQKFYQE
ncbi:MAG TPA: hypothetical protein PKC21_06470 [Oligoflexia bacterium]|nr:hypothetical protein [Oligoflexia bacterium]HMR24979.1 hypothetical protein [Oligoflexia bacterium]